jgi:NAD(P)H-hydrate epimerase
MSYQPVPTLTPDEMAQVDRVMIDELGVEVLQLMELAGRAIADWARERFLGDATGKRVLVLAGSGGNGGDGMVAARLLHAWGALPTIRLSHEAQSLRGAAAHQAHSLEALGLPLLPPPENDDVEPLTFPEADLIIDGLFGFGLSGAPTGASARLIEAANAHPAPILAIDLPSGLDAASGEPYDPCIRAEATLTLALPKTGLLNEAAGPFVGELAVADIGVPAAAYARLGLTVDPLFGRRSIVRVEQSSGLVVEGSDRSG